LFKWLIPIFPLNSNVFFSDQLEVLRLKAFLKNQRVESQTGFMKEAVNSLTEERFKLRLGMSRVL
jgi:hypothetical protein